jgi:cholinesterase
MLHSYSPDYILMSDVVLVIFNYRLGPLGFLKMEDKSLNVPGNAGMKDQQMAMRFVRDNIHNFGGDANNVTLMGHSSGASCVGLHCIAKSSSGLFQRAAIMSGSPVGIECETVQLGWAKRLAEKLGFDGNLQDEREILRFLEDADAQKLAATGVALATNEEKQKHSLLHPFCPLVEDDESDLSFLTSSPKDLLTNAWSNDIDIMIGGTMDEGLAFGVYSEGVDLSADIPNELNLDRNDPKFGEFVKRLESFYFKNFESKAAGYIKVRKWPDN